MGSQIRKGKNTGISWTNTTWGPVRGCSRVSAGCEHCYAERLAIRSAGPGGAYEGLVQLTPQGPRWTRKVLFVPEKLDEPLRWKRPRMVFVNSMSDLFHEALPANDIALIYATMAQARRHTFQVLTKRADRAASLLSDASFIASVAGFAGNMMLDWPLENVWHGVSVEDQLTADIRVPSLMATPAAVRWISAEPLLGPVNLMEYLGEEHGPDWLVCGGESGPRARPFDLVWMEELRRDCAAHGVAYFGKQVGSNPQIAGVPMRLLDQHGKDMAEWPAELRVREWPCRTRAARLARSGAGTSRRSRVRR